MVFRSLSLLHQWEPSFLSRIWFRMSRVRPNERGIVWLALLSQLLWSKEAPRIQVLSLKINPFKPLLNEV